MANFYDPAHQPKLCVVLEVPTAGTTNLIILVCLYTCRSFYFLDVLYVLVLDQLLIKLCTLVTVTYGTQIKHTLLGRYPLSISNKIIPKEYISLCMCVCVYIQSDSFSTMYHTVSNIDTPLGLPRRTSFLSSQGCDLNMLKCSKYLNEQ